MDFKDPLIVSFSANRVFESCKTCESTLCTQGFQTHVVVGTRFVLLWMVLSAGGHGLLISLSNSSILLIEDGHLS
jgi:hypothetical protein